ncbi:MAG: TetR/AcrR family transcriptional regulator [Alphaproteobacteria bacterium]|nr:TetR/AcrR family transcriptional regulator [Alphaproteobacteria bacterium]
MSERGARRTARDQQREETRERVFLAALDIFREQGMASARIEDIASAADVSRGTFYFHFPRREDVMLELLDRSQQALAEKISAMPAGTPIADILYTVSRDMAERWEPEPALLSDLGGVALAAVDASSERSPERGAGVTTLVERFRTAVERGELLTLINPELLTTFFLVNIFAAAWAWTRHQDTPMQVVLDGVVAFFLRGAAPE